MRAATATSIPVTRTPRPRSSLKGPALATGDLEIVATARDATGRITSARLTVWVAGPSAKPEREAKEPALTLQLDRRSYRPGETAKVWVSANTRGRPILIVLEGA